ncbi:non-ribosomal peptide synthetase [Streptomyces sp. NA02950]|uniref:non-ribosomal peptide synthetase n=1 Tax=Streptomyces sp. NA02950 TaxID=2742137 RepID=UPI001590EFB9|nr:non-ribosomal peptide synthetase [Streptomyces sp. NA02950]QKV91484.1 non-ribosomal peptide synthetase [Streptomyces sp. NA02950]
MTSAPPPDTGHRPFPTAESAGTLVHRFLETARARPDREAVVTPEVRWTYRQAEERSARVCGALRTAGLRPGDRVGLLFSHGAEMIAALLGALRAGVSYVPLDGAYPAERLGFMASDAGVRALVTGTAHTALAERLAGGAFPVLAYEDVVRGDAAAGAGVHAVPEGEAYVLYTSGSTGRPKPVAQWHRNVLHHTRAWADGLAIGPRDRLTLQSAYSWDSAVQDTFAALLTGAALYPVDLKALGVTGLLEWMAAEELTVYHSTLPVFRALVRAMAGRGVRLPAMRMLALGGDTLHLADLDAARRHFESGCQVAGAYGSTECSCALLRVADPGYRPPTGVFPLGDPVPETEVRLEDAGGRTVEGPGEGEIVVVSRYLAPGSVPDGRTYRTGDLARRLDDGTLLLIGRRDFQVKISGIRVETGEVESALKQLPQIREAVVMPFTDGLGERQLAGYVVAADGARAEPAALRTALRRTLPDHAVPTAYVPLDELPLTANHKIDRAALPHPSTAATTGTGTGEPPPVGSPAERAVLEAWREVLGVARPGPDDNFFDLGGTSLRMAAVHERLTRTVAPALRMTDLYRAPTVRALARLIAPATAPPETAATSRAAPGGGSAPGRDRGERRRGARSARRSEVRARIAPPDPRPPFGETRDPAPGGIRD